MAQQTSITGDIKKRSGWSIFMGVLIVILGAFLIVYPLATAALTTVLIGWGLIFAGLWEVIFAFNSTTPGTFFADVLLGIVCGITGILLVVFPPQGMATLTAVLGVLLLVQAGILTYIAFQLRPADGWGSFLFDAVVTFLAGGLILWQWPSSSVWAIGTLVGVAIVMRGISRIVIGSAVHRGAREVEQAIRA